MHLGSFLARWLNPESRSVLLRESWTALPLCSCTRLTARDEDHWEKEEVRVEQESFCNYYGEICDHFLHRGKTTRVVMRYSRSSVMVNLVYIYTHIVFKPFTFSQGIKWSYECLPVKQLLWFSKIITELFCLNSKHNICRKMSSAHHPFFPNIKQSDGSIVLRECFLAVEAARLVSVKKKS